MAISNIFNTIMEVQTNLAREIEVENREIQSFPVREERRSDDVIDTLMNEIGLRIQRDGG